MAAADELLKWFKAHGGQLNGVDVRYTVAEGRGLFAERPLQKGTVAVTVPTDLVLRAQTCLDNPQSRLHSIPPKVQLQLREGPALVALCMLELQSTAQWMPYTSAISAPEGLLLIEATKQDLNHTLQGSQLLREVQQKLDAVTKLFHELDGHLKPSVASFAAHQFIEAYALVESRSHSEVIGAQGPVAAAIPVADLLNHATVANAELRATAAGVQVVLLQDLAEGDELYLSYLSRHGMRRSSFYRQFAVDDLALPNDIKLAFYLRPSDPLYNEKKLRFPQHMVEAKKLYEELAYLLPYEKKQDLPQALSFPHFLELTCDRAGAPQGHNALPFLRFVVADRVPTEEECPGRPALCPYLDAKTETKALRRFQHDLLKYRAQYQDFASPRAGGAGKILDDERLCLDRFLTDAGAPPPPIVGLYSGCGFLVVLSAVALFRAQRAIWL